MLQGQLRVPRVVEQSEGRYLDGRITLQPGDDVVVTVLDSSGETFEVLAAQQYGGADVPLGTLTASGSVRIP